MKKCLKLAGLFVIFFTIIVLAGCNNPLWNSWGADNVSSINTNAVGNIRGVVTVSSTLPGFPNIKATANTNVTPVNCAEVWLLDLPDVAHVFTNASGVYIFENIPAGNHEIVASYTTTTANGILKGKTDPIGVQTGNQAEINAPDITLNNASKQVKGILNPVGGNFPAGTKIRLWGEYFTIDYDGSFISPPLPNDVLEADFELIIPGREITKIRAGFTGTEIPAFIEQSVSLIESTNHSPSGVLTAENSYGEILGKCQTSDVVNFSVTGYDQDYGHANLIDFQWSASNGNLSIAPDKKSAQWTAMPNAGVATITVLLTDPENATSSVSLMILVGIDSVEQADTTPPAFTFGGLETSVKNPTLTGSVDDSNATILLTVNEKTYQGTVSNGSWSVSITDELTPGVYSLVLECKDQAGNVSRKTFENALNIAQAPVPDITTPKVVLSSETSGETAISPIVIKVEFDEAINGLETTDFVVTNGSVSKLTEVVASRTFSLEIIPAAAGTVNVDLPSAKVTDDAGNENEAASQFSINYKPADQIKPTVTINQKYSQEDPTSDASVVFAVEFSEPVKDFSVEDLDLTGTANPTTASINEVEPNNKTTYEVTVSNISKYGTIIVSMEAGKVTDLAGNANEASTSSDNTVTRIDNTPPAFVGHLGGNKTGFWTGDRFSYHCLRILAEDSQHNLYTVHTSNDYEITKIDSAGNIVEKIGSKGTENGQFQRIVYLAIDSADNIFVSDSGKITKLDKNGAFIEKFGFGGPLSINNSDEIFSSNIFKQEIYKYDNAGNQLATITVHVNSSNRPMYPSYIDHDSAGNLYVCSDSNFDIQKYDASGNFVSMVSAKITPEHAPMLTAHFKAMKIDNSGNMFVMPRYSTYILQLDSSGNEVAAFGGKGVADNEFYNVCNAFIITSNNDFVITEDNGHSIKIFGSDFQYKKEFTLGGYGSRKFAMPMNVAVDKDNNFYVADSGGYSVKKYSVDGTFQLMIGSGISGTVGGQFINPTDVVVDNSGNIFVLDMYSREVQKFDSNGNFLLKFGGKGTGVGQFNDSSYNMDLALDSAGNLYVCENITDGRIQKFSNDGNFISVVGTVSWYHPDILCDKNDNLLVLDMSTLTKYDSTGKEIERFECEGESLALGNNGEIFTSNQYGFSITKYSPSGQKIVTWGTKGSGDGQFDMPYGIACDSNGNLYIVDLNNNTVEKYTF